MRCPEAEAQLGGARRLGHDDRRRRRRSRRFGRLAAAAARPIDDHRSTRRVPPPRRRCAGDAPGPARGGGRAASPAGHDGGGVTIRTRLHRLVDHFVLHVNGVDRRGPRLVARREPAVRVARAARAGRAQGRVRAGRVRVVQRARRRRAGVLVPRAGGVGGRSTDRHGRRARAGRCRRPTCSRRSSTPARCSAGSARRA